MEIVFRFIHSSNFMKHLTNVSTWKQELQSKGLRVNMGKTNVLHSSYGSNTRTKTGKWPCGVCNKGVGANSIFFGSCKHWVHKRCSGVNGKLKENDTFKCKICIHEECI